MDNAAPIPVPVQIRIPRLNMADACPTPAVIYWSMDDSGRENKHTKLQLPCPHRFWRIDNKSLSEVTLNAADHIMIWRFPALANDSKGVVLHDRGATDSAQ